MSKKIQLFLFAGIVSVLFASCQNEESEIVQNQEETLTAAAPLTNLLSRVAMSDATSDNIIDSTDCFKVKLPVEVLVNNQPVFVSSEEDFAAVEAIFNQYGNDNDCVKFLFPITIIYPDYSEVTVNSQEQFDVLANGCTATGPGPVFDAPVSCFNLVYPITISGYASAVQQAQTYTINSDQELFLFLASLSATEYYAINYPVSAVNEAGETITINSNSECQQAIAQAINFCYEIEDFCQGSDVAFTTLFDSLANVEGVMEGTVWSAVTHEYTFSKSTDATICTIGYISPTIGGAYMMEVLKEDGTVLYSGFHTFEADQLTHISITPVNIQANQKYIIRRRNPNGSGGLCKVVSRIEGLDPILPATSNGLTIYSSKYYGGGTGDDFPNVYLLPFISVGFSQN
ncbi:hypothetical protein J2X31_001847 [Flavobacterium arsenatis]|uniref:Lipoprotein n=1 Tax=Flavobacterium arsenatis TaxID=1484332 RepID=A0ABU1TPP1_9FLAO|nr:hypothetical protein [Flavobacterium arsenatis]MDR6967833.1 hypothetical protein [Flavobacterium arsenatis]